MRICDKAKLRKALGKLDIDGIFDVVCEIKNECEERYDNLSESQQESEKGEKMQTEIEHLHGILDCLEELQTVIEDADVDIEFII